MENEFIELNDLALSRGIKHSEIIEAIHQAVLSEYRKKYPKSPPDIDVIVDEKTGAVRLLSGKEDVTPEEFAPVASSTARMILIQKIKETEKTGEKKKEERNRIGMLRWVPYVLFGGYHTMYFLFVFLFLLSLLQSDLRHGIIQTFSDSGAVKSILTLCLALLPLASFYIAIKKEITNSARLLAKFFFLLEIPLIILLFIGQSMISELTPVVQFFYIILLTTPFVFFAHFIHITIPSKRLLVAYMILKQVILITVGYLTVLYSFFMPLIIGSLFNSIGYFFRYEFNYLYLRNIFEVLFMLIFAGISFIFLLGLFLFAVSPYAATFLSYRSFFSTRKAVVNMLGEIRTLKLNVFAATSIVILVTVLAYQPDITLYITKLENLKDMNTYEEKQQIARELHPHKEIIKRGFEDMRNLRTRYIMAKDDDYLKNEYIYTLKFDDFTAEFIQTSFMSLAYPFVYWGNLDRQGVAYNNYYYLFGEHVSSYRYSNYTYKEPENVHLEYRKISATSHYQDLLAKVMIEEEYDNTSYSNQEIIYEFSLPSDAVVMDLKLGPDLEFDGLVAPRGAASNTYQTELNRSRDPALLEQTGPRQYRLRVFPIPSKSDYLTLRGKKQKMQFSYVTSLTPDGYPLPVYSKQSNLKIDGDTVKTYSLDGYNNTVDKLEAYLTDNDRTSAVCDYTSRISAMSRIGTASAVLIPYASLENMKNTFTCDTKNGMNLNKSIVGTRIAVFYDTTAEHKTSTFPEDLRNLLISDKSLMDTNYIDLFYFNDLISQPKQIQTLDLEEPFDIVYFGKRDNISQNAYKDIQQLLYKQYSFILIVTDKNQDMLNEILPLSAMSPVYILHTGKSIPSYTSKITTSVIQSGGTVVSSMKEAINHFILTKRVQRQSDKLNYISAYPYFSIGIDQHLFRQRNNSEIMQSFDYWKNISASSDPLVPYMGKAYFSYAASSYLGEIENQMSFLDASNRFAREFHIVTPYSSLIALVNEQQKQNLENFSQYHDRYSESQSSSNLNFRFNQIDINQPSQTIGTSPLSSIIGMGAPKASLGLPTLSGGGGGGSGGSLDITAPSSTSMGSSSLSSGLFYIFVLINIAVFGFAFVAFASVKLIRIARNRLSKHHQ